MKRGIIWYKRGEFYLETWISFFEKSVELSLCSLLCTKRNHHCNIHLAEMVLLGFCCRARLGHDDVVYKKRRARIAVFQSVDHAAENLDAIVVVVVV